MQPHIKANYSDLEFMSTLLNEVQTWYQAQCDGDWEHKFGITIRTLDNPGWSVRIDLNSTLLEDKIFASIGVHETEQSWISCEVEGTTFVGRGDTSRLEEILSAFLNWAKSEPDWLAVPVESEDQIEAREERAFWLALQEEAGTEKCRKSDCERPKIRFSIFCRKHHFEMVKGKPAPE